MDQIIIPESELILNEDGSIYHLNLKPGEVAKTIITVGDPERVDAVAKYFDHQYLTKQKREFKTVTGQIGSTDLTVISTGMGTDNIDIAFNELDALFNIDFETRKIREELSSVKFIRLGTSGCIQADIPIDTVIISAFAVETENILCKYGIEQNEDEKSISEAVHAILDEEITLKTVAGDSTLIEQFKRDYTQGITYTAGGFYAPQGRSLRIKSTVTEEKITALSKLSCNNIKVTNFEMETAGIYGFAKLFGHQALSFNALLANRQNKTFSSDPSKIVTTMIENVLAKLTS